MPLGARPSRSGSTTPTSASTTTCATPRCRRPATRSSCGAMAARVFSQHLDRARPLWELWMVEGLRGGRWALLSKVHHCMVDGVAATDLMSVMFDDDAGAAPPRRRRGGRARAVAAGARRAHAPRWRSPSTRAAQVRARAARAGATLRAGALDTARAARRRRPALRPAHLLAHRPDRPAPRAGAGRKAPLARRQGGARGARRHGQRRRPDDRHATASATCSRRAASSSRPDRVVRTMVPVSVRRPGERGVYNNRVSAVFARLPVGARRPGGAPGAIRAGRWTGSSRPSRPSPATRWPSCRASRRRCCSRSAAAS